MRIPRLFAALAAALACAGVVSACDASPTAATVDGSRIKQTALNQLIDDARHSPAYVGLLQTVASNTGNGQPIQLSGEGAGTYSKQLAAVALTNLITAEVIHRAVTANHEQPGPAMLQAARSTSEALFDPDGFTAMPVPFRDQLVTQLAERAELEAPLADTTRLRQVYQAHLASYYRQVCVQQVSVIVPNGSGGVDQIASQYDASAISAQFNASGRPRPGSPGVTGGTTNCYSQEQLEATDSGFRSTVMSLAPGHASNPLPAPAGAGYNVIAVLSRSSVPFNLQVRKAITAAILELYPAQDSTVNALLQRAAVKVDPQYGSWRPSAQPPAVAPPSAPARAPGTPLSTVPNFGSSGAS